MHLIAKSRLSKDYIIRLNAGIVASAETLNFLRHGRAFATGKTWREYARLARAYLGATGVRRQVVVAEWKARRGALRSLAQLDQSGNKLVHEPVGRR